MNCWTTRLCHRAFFYGLPSACGQCLAEGPLYEPCEDRAPEIWNIVTEHLGTPYRKNASTILLDRQYQLALVSSIVHPYCK
jgi:hypothetical protein